MGWLTAGSRRVHAATKPAVNLRTFKCQNKEAFTWGVFSLAVLVFPRQFLEILNPPIFGLG